METGRSGLVEDSTNIKQPGGGSRTDKEKKTCHRATDRDNLGI